MSIMDAKLVFSETQTSGITAAGTQTISTNIIDLGAENLGIGAGTPLYLNIRLAESFTTIVGETGSYTFKLDHDTGTNWADTGPALMEKKINISALSTIGGLDRWIWRVALPTDHLMKRYLRLLYVRGLDASTAFTSGIHFDAWISGATPETKVGT